MKTSGKININVPRTVENAVNGRQDFHFYVDELTSENYMPTYAGMADEKYGFESMDEDFFNFLEEKIAGDGIYIRLILATGESTPEGARFTLECGDEDKSFVCTDDSNLLVFEFADYGIKVQKGEVTLGTTVEGGCVHTPYFAEFGSVKGNEQYLSLDNPLNRFVIEMLWKMIEVDE